MRKNHLPKMNELPAHYDIEGFTGDGDVINFFLCWESLCIVGNFYQRKCIAVGVELEEIYIFKAPTKEEFEQQTAEDEVYQAFQVLLYTYNVTYSYIKELEGRLQQWQR